MNRVPFVEAVPAQRGTDPSSLPVVDGPDTLVRLAARIEQASPGGHFAAAVPQGSAVHQIIQLQIQLMAQQLALLAGMPAPVATGLQAVPADRPSDIHAVEAPVTEVLHPAREPLHERFIADAPQDVSYERAAFDAPANGTEQAIAAVWARLLNVTHVGRNDNFFNLGGHSLLAVRAVQEMQRVTGEKIAVGRLIFESLGQIAAAIAIAPVPGPAGDAPDAAVPAGPDAANGLSGFAMTPVRFGYPASSLYGVFHGGGGHQAQARQRAVLFCNPFGQEAVRTHRLFRVLADRLARTGVACLRFDYYASGESFGDDHEADLDRWVRDVAAADAVLRQRAGVQQVDWLAPRLASALAVRASARAPLPPRQLVLWEPVLAGGRYVDHLLAAHASVIADLPDGGALAGDEEILGFGVSRRLLEQMRAVVPADYQHARARGVTWIASHRESADTDECIAALQGRGVTVRRHALSLDFDWTSEEAFNTALVPQGALDLLEAVLTGDPLE